MPAALHAAIAADVVNVSTAAPLLVGQLGKKLMMQCAVTPGPPSSLAAVLEQCSNATQVRV